MKRGFAAALASATVLTAACQSQQATSHGPSPAPSTVAAKPAVDLHCSLPVIALTTAGFVDFPAGTFRADPTAPPNLLAGGYVYAWGVHRWVKAPPGQLAYEALSPDGTQLALTQATARAGYTGVAIVDFKSGATRHVGDLAGRGARVIAFAADGIYLAADLVFRMDPASGAVTVIGPKPADAAAVRAGAWLWVTSTAVWYSLLPAPNQGSGDPVVSLSRADGSMFRWYAAPAHRTVSIVGFVTPSEPLVVEYEAGSTGSSMTDVKFMLLSGPGVIQDPGFGLASPASWGVTDTYGVWLSTGGHVWLYDRKGMEPMADIGAAIGQGVAPTPLGACH